MRIPGTPRARLGGRTLTGSLRYVAIAGLTVGSLALIACGDDNTATPATTSSPTITATSGSGTPTPAGTGSPTATGTATVTETPVGTPATGPSTLDVGGAATSDGTSLTIASVNLPAPGFVAIHSDDNGAPGPVIGFSELLPAGASTDIAITLDQPLTASGTVYPMVHIDANSNGVYEFPGPDGPGLTADGQVAVAPLEVTVEAAPATETATSAPEAASMTVEDQTGDGNSVLVASVVLPDGGFVAIHSDDNGAPGPVIGHSDLLPPGVSEDVEVILDEPLTADATVFPMAHLDADGDGVYTFPGPDGPAVDAAGAVLVAPIAYTVQAAAASMTVEDQAGDGSSVMVASVVLPDGGFVAIHSDDNGAPGPVIGHSDLLPPGVSEDVEVILDEPLTADATVFPMAHLDADGDGVYTFPGPDGPAVDAAGAVLVAPVAYTVQAAATPTGGASITSADQEGDGTTIIIAAATLPAGGFIAIHSDDGGAPGPVIGFSDLLPPGESTDIEIFLDEPLIADAVVYPMAHIDADGDGVYVFPGPDVPDTDAAGAVVVTTVNYTVTG